MFWLKGVCLIVQERCEKNQSTILNRINYSNRYTIGATPEQKLEICYFCVLIFPTIYEFYEEVYYGYRSSM